MSGDNDWRDTFNVNGEYRPHGQTNGAQIYKRVSGGQCLLFGFVIEFENSV